MKRSACLLALLCATVVPVWSQVPLRIDVQGVLSSAGTVPDSVDMLFTLYDSLGFDIWSESHTDVPLRDGQFDVTLGSTSQLDELRFHHPYQLGVTVGADAEMAPKIELSSVPYALTVRGIRFWPGGGIHGPTIIGGYSGNTVKTDPHGIVIGGGGAPITAFFDPSCTPTPSGRSNVVGGDYGAIVGGLANLACAGGFVGGGQANQAQGAHSVVSGGFNNKTFSDLDVIGGGRYNAISVDSRATVIAGGDSNTVKFNSPYSAILGGWHNEIDGHYAVLGGGRQNDVTGDYGVVVGGRDNFASGFGAVVPGGIENQATANYTFAGGYRARANHSGTFVWGDTLGTSSTPFASTGSNQFLIRGGGGVGIGTNAPKEVLHASARSGRSAIFLGGNGLGGATGVIFDDSLSGAGVSLLFRTGPNQLVLERGSQGSEFDPADAFVYDRDDETFSLIRQAQAARHQLEIRTVGGITSSNHGGIRFTQDLGGLTTLAELKIHYHNTGSTDVSLGNRDFPTLVFLEDDGQVGIGTTTPSEKLEVDGNVLANNVNVPSDRRMKRNIEPVHNALSTAIQLQGVTYEWRTDEYPDKEFEQGRHLGFIAQDVEEILPEAVRQSADGTYSMNYQSIIPVLLEAIKEQQALIESQNERIARLETRPAP